jgi:uncharacterized protein HemY
MIHFTHGKWAIWTFTEIKELSMKKFIAAFVGIAFLFSTVSAPLVEAQFLERSARRRSDKKLNRAGRSVRHGPWGQGRFG